MRGKKAKQLRDIASRIAERQALPDLLYMGHTVRKNFVLAGITVPVAIQVKQLGECKRKVYKDLKRFYKLGLGGLYD